MLDSEQYFSEQGLELRDAIFHAGRRRLRPILALAAIFGMLPLAIAVIGGVTVSMVLALWTPARFYTLRQREL